MSKSEVRFFEQTTEAVSENFLHAAKGSEHASMVLELISRGASENHALKVGFLALLNHCETLSHRVRCLEDIAPRIYESCGGVRYRFDVPDEFVPTTKSPLLDKNKE